MVIIILVNYGLILFNLDSRISPREFPYPFKDYPQSSLNEGKPIYFIPFFQSIKFLKEDPITCFLLGVGIQR